MASRVRAQARNQHATRFNAVVTAQTSSALPSRARLIYRCRNSQPANCGARGGEDALTIGARGMVSLGATEPIRDQIVVQA